MLGDNYLNCNIKNTFRTDTDLLKTYDKIVNLNIIK